MPSVSLLQNITKTMISVKFSSPKWGDFGYENLGVIGQTPNNLGIWGNLKFEINNKCNECDIWIIYESVQDNTTVSVPKGRTILVTSEEVAQRSYSQEYLKQFDWIITSREDINGKNVIKTYYSNAWFVKKTYDQLLNDFPIKTKNLSVIASDLVKLEGHKKRFALVNKLIGHFKDKIDVYGRGFNPIEDKYNALAPYKYSIAIENAQIKNYWTEKIADCYLSNTMPIYSGCPNISDFFEEDSYVNIDVNDFRGTIQTIEQLIEVDRYSEKADSIQRMKYKVLNELQFFPLIDRLIKENILLKDNSSSNRTMKIKPYSSFEKKIQFKSKIVETIQAGKSLFSK